MDVAPSYINFLDLIFSVRRVAIPNPSDPSTPRIMRRVISIDEVVDSTKWVQSFVWDPIKDKFQNSLDKSVKLRKLAKDFAKTTSELMFEIENRVTVLQWLRSRNIRNFIEISTIFSQYHTDPESVMTRIKLDTLAQTSFGDVSGKGLIPEEPTRPVAEFSV